VLKGELSLPSSIGTSWWKRFVPSNRDAGEETPYWDSVVFNKVKARFGGRIRLIVSGSAPLSPTVQHFLKMYVMAIISRQDRHASFSFSFAFFFQ